MRLLLTGFTLLVFLAALAFAASWACTRTTRATCPTPVRCRAASCSRPHASSIATDALLQELNDPTAGRRTLVPISEVPPVMRAATIAAEDASFFDNPGFDPRAVLRATYQWIRSGAPQSGASTITQQLVKNTLLGPEQTAERKIKEAFLAMELTRRYSKDQILEMYLNEISFGNRAYGDRGRGADVLRQARARAHAGRGGLPGRAAAGAVVLRPVHQHVGGQRAPASTCSSRWCARARSPPAQRDAAARAELKLAPAATLRHARGAALRHLRAPADRGSLRHRGAVPRRPADHDQPRPRPAARRRGRRAPPHRRHPRAQRDQRRRGRHAAAHWRDAGHGRLGRLRRCEHRRPGQRRARPAPAGFDPQAVHLSDRVPARAGTRPRWCGTCRRPFPADYRPTTSTAAFRGR